MSRTLLQVVLRHAEALAAGEDTPDAELVLRFARGRDDAAFAELVRRHGPMVWAACRHLLPDPADAEDAFQATFLALVRSAAKIRTGSAVGGWLHGVAVRVATKAKRSAVRRRQREEKAAGAEAGCPVPDTRWESLIAAVHEEVQELPEPLRAAFVLCDLEGVRQPDAAVRLGWKPGTLTGRLCKARQELLDRLAKRGLAPALAAGAVGLGATTAAAAVPAGLVAKVSALAGGAAAVSPAVLELVTGVLPMTVSRAKLMAAAVLAAGGLSLGLGSAVLPSVEARPPAVTDDDPPVAEPKKKEKGKSGGTNNPFREPGQPGQGGPRPGGPGPGTPGGGLPGAAGGPPGGGEGRPGFPGGGGPGGMMGGFAVSHASWEYRFIDRVPSAEDFKKVVQKHGGEGWEFCGMGPDGMIVLKRAAGRGGMAGGAMFGGGPGGPGGAAGGGEGGFGGRTESGPARGGFGGGRTGGPGGPPGAGVPGGVPMGPGPVNPPRGGGGAGGRVGPVGPGGPPHDGKAELVVIPLKSVAAQDVVRIVTETVGHNKGDMRVVAEDRSNSIILYAAADDVKVVKELIEKLDAAKPAGGPGPKR